jgi:hypothetical protein
MKINSHKIQIHENIRMVSFYINADLFESPTAAIGCITHFDTNSIHAVKTKTVIYEQEEGLSFHEHANSIFVGGGQLLCVYRHTFITI